METYDSHKTTTEVRQGSRRLDNFWVLIVSLLLLIAIFGVLFFVFYFNATPPSVVSP